MTLAAPGPQGPREYKTDLAAYARDPEGYMDDLTRRILSDTRNGATTGIGTPQGE